MASVIGPTLLDLQRLTHTTIESFAIIFPVRAVIGLSGAILGGLLVNRVHYWMLLGVMMSVVGVATILMPHMRHLATLGLFMSIGYWAAFLFNAGMVSETVGDHFNNYEVLYSDTPMQHTIWAPVGPQLGQVGPSWALVGPNCGPCFNAAWATTIWCKCFFVTCCIFDN